jgi:hypothetical protein
MAALTAAGTGATVYNTNQTEKRQDNALAAQLRGDADKQREADAKVNELLNQQAASTPDDEKAGALDSFMQQMQAKRGNTQLRQAGATSDAQRAQANDAALGVSSYGDKIAGLLASIDAPAQQRQNEAITQGRFGQEIDRIKRFSAGDDFLAQMRLRGIKRNPWIDLAGGALSAAGGAMGASQGVAAGEPSPYGAYASGYRYPTSSKPMFPLPNYGG